MGDIVWRLRDRAEKMLADRKYAVNPALLKQAADVIESYQDRLEIRYAYRKGPDDAEPVKYEIPEAERDDEPDGIDCRDATIRLLEDNWQAACDRADTAFLRGVKAGLEAAAQWADREKATYVKWVGQCAGHDERYMAADAIRAIDSKQVVGNE